MLYIFVSRKVRRYGHKILSTNALKWYLYWISSCLARSLNIRSIKYDLNDKYTMKLKQLLHKGA